MEGSWMEVTAVSQPGSLASLPAALSCDVCRISGQVPGCPGILALEVFIDHGPEHG